MPNIYKSTDNVNFSVVGSFPSQVNQFVWQGLPGKYIAAADDGLLTTPDGGATFGYLRPNAVFGTSWPVGAIAHQVAFAIGPNGGNACGSEGSCSSVRSPFLGTSDLSLDGSGAGGSWEAHLYVGQFAVYDKIGAYILVQTLVDGDCEVPVVTGETLAGGPHCTVSLPTLSLNLVGCEIVNILDSISIQDEQGPNGGAQPGAPHGYWDVYAAKSDFYLIKVTEAYASITFDTSVGNALSLLGFFNNTTAVVTANPIINEVVVPQTGTNIDSTLNFGNTDNLDIALMSWRDISFLITGGPFNWDPPPDENIYDSHGVFYPDDGFPYYRLWDELQIPLGAENAGGHTEFQYALARYILGPIDSVTAQFIGNAPGTHGPMGHPAKSIFYGLGLHADTSSATEFHQAFSLNTGEVIEVGDVILYIATWLSGESFISIKYGDLSFRQIATKAAIIEGDNVVLTVYVAQVTAGYVPSDDDIGDFVYGDNSSRMKGTVVILKGILPEPVQVVTDSGNGTSFSLHLADFQKPTNIGFAIGMSYSFPNFNPITGQTIQLQKGGIDSPLFETQIQWSNGQPSTDMGWILGAFSDDWVGIAFEFSRTSSAFAQPGDDFYCPLVANRLPWSFTIRSDVQDFYTAQDGDDVDTKVAWIKVKPPAGDCTISKNGFDIYITVYTGTNITDKTFIAGMANGPLTFTADGITEYMIQIAWSVNDTGSCKIDIS